MLRIRGGTAAVLLVFAALGQASAASLDALQGAWTMNGTSCEDTFSRVNGKLEFTDRTSSLTTGVIIDGSKVIGANNICTAERIRQEEDNLIAYLTCNDSVLVSGFSVAFRMVDDEHLIRFDSMFPDMSVTYQKCK